MLHSRGKMTARRKLFRLLPQRYGWRKLVPALLFVSTGTERHQRCEELPANGAWLFIYFKEPANQGIYLALSRDGYSTRH